ncbi:TonB-dependent receptor [Acidipila sp. EB88]|uniref:TonB-dependent receptor n=1 Tax=Acidipila sp. EB88 TaxID=2305226 RepID=UPI000F5F9373|nr:carboxypeptidase regulatory-like domain-containing protein [Acidipila sp. EB88]RRA47773.1 TonB-dependent receptor [Acidipila sp. EB88]
MNTRTRALALSSFVIAGSAAGYAQSTATLSGNVTDPAGAVVPQAQINVHGLATGVDRVVISDAAGNYSVPSLQPGNYSVTVHAAGFADYRVQSITLQVDQNVTSNAKLGLAATGEVVQVQGATPIIDAQTITVGQVIDQKTVQEIPLNGRHFLDLTNLTPGTVVPPVTGSLTSASRGLGANSFNTAGQREDSVNFMINGINLNDLTQNQITFQPSINTTSEFKILNSTYSAEYGRSSGAVVNVATRSGTNQFHGEAFDYLRNNYFDARNYFNRKPQQQNQFIRNNFGGAFSGPLWKDRTFFFLSYEGLRQQQSLPLTSGVLNTTQRNTLAANTTIPGYAGLLQFIPAPPATASATGQATVTGAAPGPVKTDQFSGDLFHTISQQDNVHAYYAWQQDARTEPNLQGNTIAGFGDHRTAHRQIGTVNEVHIFSPNVVNEARLGFNRIAIAFSPNTPENPASFGIQNGVAFNNALPQISISDIGLNFGGPSGFPQGRFVTTGVFSDTLSINRGKNTIRAGGEYRRAIVDSYSQTAGTMNFDTANNFVQGLVNSFSVTPQQVVSRVFANAVGAFVTDNYKVTPRFNAEIGFRYEWNGTPTEGGNRLVNFLAATDTLTPVSQPYTQNYNYEPRVGFIYDVFGNQQTVLRGGYGIMADQPVTGVAANLAGNPPNAAPVSFAAATVAGVKQYAAANTQFTSAGLSGLSPAAVNPLLTNAYTESYNLNLQQQLGAGVVMDLGFIGSEGKHLRLTRNINQFLYPNGITATGVRPFAHLATTSPERPGSAVGAINMIDSDSLSNYNALWFTMRKALQHGLQINATYTWSKSQDENSLGSQGGASLQDNNNPRGDYALSDFDSRNHFVFSGTWNLPFHGSRLVDGWLLANITQLQTGNPLNVVTTSAFDGDSATGTIRPTLLGMPQVGHKALLTNGNVSYIANPAGSVCATVTTGCVFYAPAAGFGTLRRNAFTGPGFADSDISLEKTTKIYEQTALVLRVDAFDALNHTNFNNPNLTATTSATSTFGQITATRTATGDAGSSRQLQFAMRFEF